MMSNAANIDLLSAKTDFTYITLVSQISQKKISFIKRYKLQLIVLYTTIFRVSILACYDLKGK